MADTIFHSIVKGEVPCYKVYEDEHVLAFLDIHPLCKGHTLVIPKVHAETLDKLPEEYAAAIGRVLPKLCAAVLKATGAHAFNVVQNNGAKAHQAVMWVHFHIIPKYDHGADDGLHLFWKPTRLEPRVAQEFQTKIAAAVKDS